MNKNTRLGFGFSSSSSSNTLLPTSFTEEQKRDLISYISNNDFNSFSKLMNKNNVNFHIDKNRHTALHLSIIFKRENFVRHLIGLDAEPHMKTCDEKDAFDLAFMYQCKFIFDNEFKENKETIRDIQTKNSLLLTEKNKLTEKCDKLQIENVAVFKENRDLKDRLELKTIYADTIKAELNNVNALNKTLLENNTKINDESKTLKSVNAKLLIDNEKFEREIKVLTTEKSALEEKLENSNKRLRDQDESYDGLLSTLKKRRRE